MRISKLLFEIKLVKVWHFGLWSFLNITKYFSSTNNLLSCFFQEVKYTNHDGQVKRSKLMLSGFWGLARHMNYVFEILLASSWSLPALHYGVVPFAYVIFLIILLVHRTFRDEEKCSAKYGDGWEQYCKIVPYRFIPYII